MRLEKLALFSAFAVTLIYAPAYAVETLIELGLEARAYSKSGLPQTHNGKLAISLQPEFTEQFEAQNVYLTLEPFFRLDQYDEELWPTNIPALYYSYHIMLGLGTIFVAIMLLALFLLWKKKLFQNKKILWVLLLSAPFPYIANLAGWYSSELGRQPWLVYNLLLVKDGVSETVSAGNTIFTLLGFVGLYFLLGVLFLALVGKVIYKGPESLTH